MRPIWGIAVTLLSIAAIILLAVGIDVHYRPLGIQDVTEQDYASIINNTVAKQNGRLAVEDSAFVDTQYVDTTIAVVRFSTTDGTRVSFLFEYYNGIVYLTNYSTTGFTATDLNNPDIAPYIGNANE